MYLTVRALYKNNPVFSKGAFCSYSFGVGVLFGYPLTERTEGVYEEDEDVGDVIGESLRPFLFLPQTILGRSPRGFVLNCMFLWPNLHCSGGEIWPLVVRHSKPEGGVRRA